VKLSEPFDYQGQSFAELELPPRMKTKFIAKLNPVVFAHQQWTFGDMMTLVDGIFQLPSGASGEMGIEDVTKAFDLAMDFLGTKASTPTASSAGGSASV
jgi:hypothetical protein